MPDQADLDGRRASAPAKRTPPPSSSGTTRTTPVTGVEQCAALCAANLECTYYSVNSSPSKGCVLKSKTRGLAVSHASATAGASTRCPRSASSSAQAKATTSSRTHSSGPPTRSRTLPTRTASTGWCTTGWAACSTPEGQKGRLLTGKKGRPAYNCRSCRPAPSSTSLLHHGDAVDMLIALFCFG